MVNNIAEDELDEEAMQTKYEFLDGDDRKSFVRESPAHVLYLWHLTHQYGILTKVRQQLHGNFVIDGTNALSVDPLGRNRKHKLSSTDPSISESSRITKIWNKLMTLSTALSVLLIENSQRHYQGSLFGCIEYVP